MMRAGPSFAWLLACSAAGVLAGYSLATGLVVAQSAPPAVAEPAAEEAPVLAAADDKHAQMMKLYAEGRYAEALVPARECLAIRRKVLGEEHPKTAASLNDVGFLLKATGDYAAARPYYERALAIRKQVLGEEHPETAESLNNLGLLLQSTGEYAAARPCLEQALAVNKKVLGEEDRDTAMSLNNLGSLLNAMGDHAAARPYYERALMIRKKVLGEEHPDTAQSLNNLGLLLHATGDYAAARPYLEQALTISKKVCGEEHPETAASLSNMGLLLQSLGDYAAARPYFEQALAINKKVLGDKHPRTAASLAIMGMLLDSMGDYAAARPYLEESLDIFKEVLGEEHPDTARCLNNLGFLLNSMGDHAAARSYFEQALDIQTKALGAEHPETSTSRNNLGALLFSMGEYAAARPYFERALTLRKTAAGEDNGDFALSLSNLAFLSAAEGDWPAAIDGLVEANRINQRSLEKVFATATETRMRTYLGTMSRSLGNLLSLPLAEFGREPDGLTWVLRRKAIVFEALCLSRTAQWLAREDPEFAGLQSALLAAQKQLDDVTLRPPAALAPEELARRREALRTQIAELQDQLQTALAAHLGGDWSLMTEIDPVRLQLPADGALVELVKYAPFNFKAAGQESPWGAERYVAFVLHADAQRPVDLVELGEAQPIDEAVAAIGQHFQDVQRAGEFANWPELEKEYGGLAAPLFEKLFAPIAAKLAGVKRVFLSPDSQLHNLPFEALVDDQGRYLAEQGYEFAYLASGRDLLRGPAEQPGEGAFVFAAPNYDLKHQQRFQLAAAGLPSTAASSAQIAALNPSPDPSLPGKGGTRSADVRGLTWKVLPGMAPEGAEAGEYLADGPYGPVQSYSGDAALEEQFKRLVHPRLVVLVTHGFFLPDQPAERSEELSGDDPTTRSAFAQGAGLARLRLQENPLYRSGVVLAGANTLDEPVPDGMSVEDGWLTAEEISQLDLRGTDLVVLSACNTSRGAVATGDAVAGLRSAFLFAGTQTLVGSLYEVPDRETRQLMQTFYAGLRQQQGKLQSLNAARLKLIEQLRAEQGAAHPFFWASFVLVGAP